MNVKKILVVALLGLSSTAFAGGFQVKVGASLIDPTADTTLKADAVVKGDYEFAFTPSVEYFFGDTPFSAEILLANPINHDVLLNGEKVASVRQLPPTITAKYNFKNASRFTPYIGVGGTAFIAWHEKGVADDVKMPMDLQANWVLTSNQQMRKTGVYTWTSVMQTSALK